MEIATGQGFVGLGEDQRIVRDAVGLGLQHAGGLAQDVERGPHHLGLAAQAIGILDPVIAQKVRGADGRPVHQVAQGVRRFDLTGMAAQSMDAMVERRVRALGGLGRKRAGDQGRLEDDFSLEHTGQGIGRRKLRAVEQGQAFLGTQYQRLQARPFQRFGGRQTAGKGVDLAMADHRRGHVGQGCQIARRADRALGRDDGYQAAVQHVFQHAHGFGLDPGIAVAEAGQLQRHHQAGDGTWHGRAGAGGMAEHDIALKCFQVGGLDARRGELAEAGIDAIDRLAARQDAFDRCRAGGDRRYTGRIEPRGRAAIDVPPLRQADGAGHEDERVRLLGGHRALRGRRGLRAD